ncbi:MAG: hypothetical protein AAF993_11895 [Pseudomonadota bacterium]
MRLVPLSTPGWLATLGCSALAVLAAISHAQIDARLRMVATQFNFSEAVHVAQQTLANPAATEHVPVSTGEWIALFNQQVDAAPEGGPAFIVNKQGNPATGAVGVSATNFGKEVHLTRPAYAVLNEHTTVVRTTEPLTAR